MAWNDKAYNSAAALAGRTGLENKRRQREFEETVLPQLQEDGLSQAAAMAVGDYFVARGKMPDDASKEIPNWTQLTQAPDEPEEEVPPVVLPSAKKPDFSNVTDGSEPEAPGLVQRIVSGAAGLADQGLFGLTNLKGVSESLFSRQEQGDLAGDAGTYRGRAIAADPSVELAGIDATLEDLDSGRATKRVPLITGAGAGPAGETVYEEVPLSAAEVAAQRRNLLARKAELSSPEAMAAARRAQVELNTRAKDAAERAKRAEQRGLAAEAGLGPVTAAVSRNVGQALQLEQALPTVGGIVGTLVGRNPVAGATGAAVGSIPMARQAYYSALSEATDQYGATPAEAAAYAAAVTAVEFGSETVAGALGGAWTLGKKFLSASGGKTSKEALKRQLDTVIKGRVRRFAEGQLAEQVGEQASSLGQMGINRALEGTSFGTAEGQVALAKSNREAVENFGQNAIDTAIQTLAVAGAPGAVAAHGSFLADVHERATAGLAAAKAAEEAEIAKVTATRQAERQRALDEETARQDSIRRRAESEEQRRAGLEAAGLQTEEEQAAAKEAQKAFGQIPAMSAGGRVLDRPINPEAELAANIVQAAPVAKETKALDRARAGFIGAERQETAEGAERPTTAGTEPFEAFAQREAARMEQENADREAQEKRAAAEAEASSRLEEARKKIAEDQKKAASTAKGNETARRNALAKQVATEHADKTPAEQAAILADLISDPKAGVASSKSKEKTPEEKVQGVINQVEGLRKRKTSERTSKLIRRLYNEDPTRTAKDIVDILNMGTTPASAAPATGGDVLSEEDIRKQLEARGGTLRMAQTAGEAGAHEQKAGGGAVPTRTAEQQKKHEANVFSLLKSLGNTQENVDISNLMKQGKIILTDKPETMGRASSADPAEFSPADGKMYVYLDNFDPTKGKEVMLQAAAAHEGGHAGQFNSRDGRSNLFQNLLGDKGNAAANATIREQAAKGNKLAQEAVKKAEEAAKANGSFTNVEDLELVPYLFSEAKIGKHAPGTVGKVIRDVKNAARAVTRKTLNKELEYSIDELAAAGNRVAGEIVKTDVKPDAEQEGSVKMTYAEGSAGFGKPENEARTFTSVDGKRKYVLSDKDSKIKDGAAFRLLNAASNGEVLTLDDLWEHKVLNKEHPDAKDIVVNVVPDSQLTGYGMYDPNTEQITVSQSLAEGRLSTDLREGLLHEVQHWVQDKTNRASSFFDAKDVQYTPETKALIDTSDKAGANRSRLARKILDDVRELTTNATKEEKEALAKRILFNRNLTDEQKVNGIRSFLEDNSIDLTKKGEAAITEWQAAQKEFATAVNARNQAVQGESLSSYLANLNEAESFRTQYDKNVSQEELDLRGNPEEAMRAQHRPQTGGRLDVPTGDGTVVSKGKSLKMAAPAQGSKPAATTPKYGVKERLQRIVAHGDRLRISQIKKGEDLVSRMQAAIKKEVPGKILNDEVNNEFLTALSSPEMKTAEGRAAVLEGLRKKYPKMTDLLVESRDFIKEQDNDIINKMLNQGRPLTTEQRKQISTILANENTYLTRAYAAFQQGMGKKWAEDRWSNAQKNLGKALDAIKNPKVRQDVENVQEALAYLRNKLVVPDEDTLADMTLQQLQQVAARYGIDPDRLAFDTTDSESKRDAIIDELNRQRASLSPKAIDDMATAAVRDLLGLDTGSKGSAYATQIKNLAKDPGTLNKREHVPLELRKLLGEITATPGVVLSTIAKQAALQARSTVFGELLNNEYGTLVMSQEDAANKQLLNNKDWTQVSGDQWGPLDGYYINSTLKGKLEDAQTIFHTWGEAIDALRQSGNFRPLAGKVWEKGLPNTIGRGHRWYKNSTVIGNPFAWVGNGVGSLGQLASDGNFNPRAVGRGMLTAKDYVAGKTKNTTTPKLDEIIRFVGVESSDIGEVQKVLGDKMEDYLDGTLDPSQAMSKLAAYAKTAKAGAGATGRFITSGYSIMDNYSKIANFYERARVLNKMYAAAGEKPSREDLLREAGDDTSLSNISMERAPKWMREVENRAGTQFMPYYYEVFRSTIGSMAVLKADIKRANELKKEGKTEAANVLYQSAARRAAGLGIAIPLQGMAGAFKAVNLKNLGIAATVGTGMALAGDDEEGEKKRRLLPEMYRNQDMFQYGTDENGMPVYLPFSGRTDAKGPLTDIMRSFVYADTPQEGAEMAYEGLKNLAFPNDKIGAPWLRSALKSITGANIPETEMSKLMPKMDSALKEVAGTELVDRVMNVVDEFLPGWVKSQHARYSPSGMVGEDKEVHEALNDSLGFRYNTFDPIPQIQEYHSKSQDKKKDHTADLREALLNTASMSDDLLLSEVAKYRQAELDRWRDDYRNTTDSLKAWKFTDEQLKQLLSEGGYTDDEAELLANGEAAISISAKGLASYIESSSKFNVPEDKQRRDTKLREVLDRLRAISPELEKIGVTLDESGLPKEYK